MKPRTKIERRFADLAGKLPPLTEARKAWARDLFPAQALYYSRRGNNCEFWCQCCGAVVPTLGKWLLQDTAFDKWDCPECGAECEVLTSYGGRAIPGMKRGGPNTSRYVTLVTAHAGMQVFRTFDVRKSVGWNRRPEFSYNEVYQNWIMPDGKEVITSRSYTRGFNHFTWDYGSQWGVNRHNQSCSGYYCYDDVYEVSGNWFFPRPRIIQTLRRNGFPLSVIGMKNTDAAEFARRLLKDNTFEEIVKLGYVRVASYILRTGGKSVQYIHAIRVCARNRYRINDPGLWFDYLDDLTELGLDTHSPHYVCPANLRRAHKQMGDRVRRLRERKEKEERRKKAAESEAKYARMKAPFLGIAFGDGDIRIAVLQSVREVMLEGDAMHHCVFDNGYYNKASSLLLSARDSSGGRLETIEIDIKRFTILQSRGLMNGRTKQHDRIVDLCRQNMDLIRRAARKSKTA